MSADIRLAFEHPEARAAATASADPHDRISLRDHIVEVEIGAFPAERGTTQRICFNVVVEVVPLSGPIDDDVDRILSYDKLTEAIAFELGAERLNLLETLAERVADRILLEPQARRVFVRVEKLDRGPGALGVEIARSRDGVDLAPADAEEEAARPHVVFLSNGAIFDPQLAKVIDQLVAEEVPLIICVGHTDQPAPHSAISGAQRRINLLAIEQNAWVLAGQDERCVVVDTRTELDWAMKNGQISVWAPSKIVLDAVESPSVGPSDAKGLALWFAKEMNAQQFSTLGTTAPSCDDLDTRELPLP